MERRLLPLIHAIQAIAVQAITSVGQVPARRHLGLLFATLALLTGGYSSFNRDWKRAAEQPVSANDMTGRWQGVWNSESTGHTDQLRCVVTKKDDGTYQARFHAKYHTVLSFGYTVPLQVAHTNGEYQFKGEADLGWLAGGVYQYDGHVTGTNFFSTYTSKEDHGTFRLGRP